MAITFRCEIVSAESQIFSGTVEFVVAEGTHGEFGIYFGHSPLLTDLKPGPIRIRKPDGKNEVFYVSGGHLEVQPHITTVLADIVLRCDQMDEHAAMEAKQRAQNDLRHASSAFDFNRASQQLAEAEAKLRTIQQFRKS